MKNSSSAEPSPGVMSLCENGKNTEKEEKNEIKGEGMNSSSLAASASIISRSTSRLKKFFSFFLEAIILLVEIN